MLRLRSSGQEDVVLPPTEIDEFPKEEGIGMLFSMASAKKYRLLKFALNASIHTLSPRQREVIVSHYWGGRTVAEIAASMGVTEQSVRKTMKTAPVEVAGVFDEWLVDETGYARQKNDSRLST